jgi:hypothetical protein
MRGLRGNRIGVAPSFLARRHARVGFLQTLDASPQERLFLRGLSQTKGLSFFDVALSIANCLPDCFVIYRSNATAPVRRVPGVQPVAMCASTACESSRRSLAIESLC